MDASITSAIAVDRLVKLYKGVAAVDGISFRLAPGSITGLLGGNGAGKTTTIAMIMGLVTPTSGTVTVLGAQMPQRALPGAAPDEFRKPLCRHADAAHRAAESVGVRAALWRCADIDERIASLAADLDLTEFLDRPTGKLSAGQKTRVSLAKALLNRPEVLLLDEPTASLDPDTADWVRGRLERYRREQRRDRAARLAQHDRGRAAVRARHHHEEGPHRGRRHAGSVCSPATAARRWRRCSSTWRAGAATSARPRNDRQRQRPRRFRVNRVAAMVRRYWYLLRSSWPRVLDLIYWPTVQMLMWGFLQLYVSQNGGFFARAGGVFIGAVLLWDILFRGQLGFSISFLEEMWARNLGNLMMSPLRPVEFIAALMIMSIVRLADRHDPGDAARDSSSSASICGRSASRSRRSSSI